MDQGFLAVLVLVNISQQQRQDQPVIYKSTMTPTVASPHTGDANEPSHTVSRHCRDQRVCRDRKQRNFAKRAYASAKCADDGIAVLQGPQEGGFITRIAFDQFCSRKIRGVHFRAHQGDDGVTLRQSVSDDQSACATCCTQHKNLHALDRPFLV